MTAEDWLNVIETYKAKVLEETGKPFPQDPKDQIWAAIGAVFGSWMNQRAITYRRLHSIPAEWGTAVNLQAMVFGNMGDDCATGVAFTRNPSTRSEEHTSELQSLMRHSYAAFCLKKQTTTNHIYSLLLVQTK